MSAQDETNFYHEGEFLNAHFVSGEDGEVSGFTLRTFGNTQEFTKTAR
jgi:hypothetical protein